MAEARKALPTTEQRPRSSATPHAVATPRWNTGLEDIYIDLMRFCAPINDRKDCAPIPLNLRYFYETNVSVIYRLLRAHPLDETSTCGVDDFAIQHMGMLLFMMTVFLDNDYHQIVNFAYVRRCISYVANNLSKGRDNVTLIWFCLLALIWTGEGPASYRTQESIRRAAVSHGVYGWQEARKALSAMPWIDSLHGDTAQGIWTVVILNGQARSQPDT